MKILKKFLKIAGIIIVSMIFFMILLVLGANYYEDRLASFTMEKLEEKIHAPMSIGKVSLIPLFSFPQLSAEIKQFWIGDQKSQNTDTLFFINSLKISLNSWDLMNGIYTIDKLEISGLDFDYTIDNNGKSNIEFILNAFVDTVPKIQNKTNWASLELSAEKFKLKNIHINYYDSLTLIGARIFIPEISIKAKTKNSVYSGKTKGSFVLSHCFYKETKVDKMESCTVNFDLKYDEDKASIKKLSIISEGFNLGMEGSFGIGDTLAVDARIKAKSLDFNILKKYIPNQINYILGDTNLALVEQLNVNLKLGYAENNIDIKKLSVKSEGVNLGMEGNLALSDTLAVDLEVETLIADFDILKKYIPNRYFKEYGIINFGGIMDISAVIKGKYADSTMLPHLNADASFRNISLLTVDYPKIDALNLKLNFTNSEKPDFSEATVNIINLNISSSKSSVHFKGKIDDFQKPRYKLSSNLHLNLKEFDSLIPDSLAQNVDGNITAFIKTKGVFPKIIPNDYINYVLDNSTISLNFREVSALIGDSLQVDRFNTSISYSPQKAGVKKILIDKLELKSEELNLDLQNSSLSVILSGNITAPKKLSANIESLKLQSEDNKIIGSGEIKNFESPEFNFKSDITLNIEKLMAVVPDSVIKSMSGFIETNSHLKGKIHSDSIETILFSILFENSNLNMALKNISIAFPDSVMNIDNLSTQLRLKNDILKIDDFSATYNGLKLEIDSSIVQNIYKTVILNQKEELYVKTHIKIGDILFHSFKHLLALNQTNSETNTKSSTDTKNWTYLIHGSASVNSFVIDSTTIDNLKINQLHVDEISTLFKFTDSSYVVDQLKFKMFEGEVNNSVHYKIRDDGTQSVSMHNIIQNINIRTLLRDMDNFGMDSLITFENINGLLTSDLNTFIPIDDSVLIDKMMVSGDITLKKGGVYNFKPAQQISKFTSIKELDNIQFKTLRSNIFMFKNKLYVPRTDIVSNALDITAFGMQSLEGNSEYHLELHLSNILFGKSKKRNKKQDKSGEEIDEGSLKKNSQKVKYAVKESKSKVSRDTKENREVMMNKIRIQKKMLDFIFFPKNIHYNTMPD